MSTTIIWQLCVRYKDCGLWRSFRTARAFETKRAALDMATDMQQHPIEGSRPERWYVTKLTLVSE